MHVLVCQAHDGGPEGRGRGAAAGVYQERMVKRGRREERRAVLVCKAHDGGPEGGERCAGVGRCMGFCNSSQAWLAQ